MPIKFKIVKKLTEDPYVILLNEPIDGVTQLRWEPLSEVEVERVPIPSTVPTFTNEEEVYGLVKEWYAAQGKPVPPEEEKACLDAIQHGWPAPVVEKGVEYESPPAKPAYGTPEFWKAYWIKKKAAAASDAGGVATAPKKESKKKVSPS